MRERKLSRINGVKVLPDQVIHREVDDCMVSHICICRQIIVNYKIMLQERKVGDLDTCGVKIEEIDYEAFMNNQEGMTQYLAKNTLYHENSLSTFTTFFFCILYLFYTANF